MKIHAILATLLLHLGLPTRFGAALVEAFPLLLPAMHGAFSLFQGGSGFLGCGAGQLLLGLEHGQLFRQGRQQGAVMAQVRFSLQTRALGLVEIILQLAQAL